MTMSALVETAQEGQVQVLTLGNGVAHPLSLAMITALHEAIDAAAADAGTNVIVLHGPGKIFCAGHDLKEIARHRSEPDHGRAYLEELFTACGRMMMAVTMSPKPVIAICEGIATAGGLQLLASCDLAYASPGATFCLPGVVNGGFCTTPAVAVSRAVGRKQVMELALSGTPVNADWALSAGLINRILPENELMHFVMDFAQTLASRHQKAVGDGKQALYRQLDMPLAEAYDHVTGVMIGHFMDPERIARDLEKWAR